MSIFKAQIRWDGYPKTLKVKADSYAEARKIATDYAAATFSDSHYVHYVKRALVSTSKTEKEGTFKTFTFHELHDDKGTVFAMFATKLEPPYEWENFTDMDMVTAWRERPTNLQLLMAIGGDFCNEAMHDIERELNQYADKDTGRVCDFLVVSVRQD